MTQSWRWIHRATMCRPALTPFWAVGGSCVCCPPCTGPLTWPRCLGWKLLPWYNHIVGYTHSEIYHLIYNVDKKLAWWPPSGQHDGENWPVLQVHHHIYNQTGKRSSNSKIAFSSPENHSIIYFMAHLYVSTFKQYSFTSSGHGPLFSIWDYMSFAINSSCSVPSNIPCVLLPPID